MIDFSLGEIVPGKVATGKVRIPNPANVSLTVKRIVKDCGCVAVDLSRDRMEPNQDLEFSFQYRAPMQGGPIRHLLEITYHELPVRTIVHVTGTVVSWVKVNSDAVDFGEVPRGCMASQRVRVETSERWPDDLREAELALEGGAIARVDSALAQSGGSLLDFDLTFAPTSRQSLGQVRGEFILRWRADRSASPACRAWRLQ